MPKSIKEQGHSSQLQFQILTAKGSGSPSFDYVFDDGDCLVPQGTQWQAVVKC